MAPTQQTLKLHGVTVPAHEYRHLERLAQIVYGKFDINTPERIARRESVRIAMQIDQTMATLVTVAERHAGAR